ASAGEGAAIVNVASMAAHMLPAEIIPTSKFPLALVDPDQFLAEMATACAIAPDEARSGLAYAISKSFVRWYSTSQAERFNGRGLR
ncbi:oxidoreductase, partial [Mycobacterium sp. ITM-2017-0098]